MSTRDFRIQKTKLKKIRTLFTLSLIVLFSLQTSLLFAFEGQNISWDRLHVKQESFKKDGVLVSRPKSLDLKIVKLIDNHKIQSLQDYARWLNQNVLYRSDGASDQWAQAQETLKKKYGDCEDYTLLNMEVLRILGYQPHFIALRRKGSAHAICVFKVNGFYLWFDNTKLHKSSTKNLQDFAKYILDKSSYSSFYELNPKTKHWNLLFRKS